MNASLEKCLTELLDTPIKIAEAQPLSGGCISEVLAVKLSVESSSNLPSQIVVKRNDVAMEENFRCEAEGLRAIAKTQTIRVPQPLANGVVDGQALLVLEWIESAAVRSHDDGFVRFGRALANF
ncbi:MAG: fructosamine kinase family protein, partial [Planctomycetota bacterium]